MTTLNRRSSGWYGFTDAQLWEQLTRAESNIRGYCHRIVDDGGSRDKLLEWIGLAAEWATRAVSICEELEARGRAPRGVNVSKQAPEQA